MKVTYDPAMFDASRQLDEIKAAIVYQDLPRILRTEQAKGFPTNKDDYTLYVRTGNRETRRKLETIRPQFLKIGSKTRPTTFRWVAHGNMEDVISAVKDTYAALLKRAPWRSGHYQNNISIVSDSGHQISYGSLRPQGYDRDARFRIAGFAEYSSIIETGFYKKYYKTSSKPGGIFYWVARKIRKQYGDRVSIRFFYLGGVGGGRRGGTVPVIEIGRGGLFAGNDTVPGRSRSRRRRSRGRRYRR